MNNTCLNKAVQSSEDPAEVWVMDASRQVLFRKRAGRLVPLAVQHASCCSSQPSLQTHSHSPDSATSCVFLSGVSQCVICPPTPQDLDVSCWGAPLSLPPALLLNLHSWIEVSGVALSGAQLLNCFEGREGNRRS